MTRKLELQQYEYRLLVVYIFSVELLGENNVFVYRRLKLFKNKSVDGQEAVKKSDLGQKKREFRKLG